MDASKFKTHANILSVFATIRYIVYIASFVGFVLFDYFIDVCSRCVICSVVTARCHASAVLATGLCLCLSDTSRSSTKTAKRRITQTTPHDSPGTLVF